MTMPTEIQAPARDGAPASTLASRVLVVDDERSMRELLSIVLRRDGYDVLVAADGKAALDVLKRERVDVLITDIRMPELTGVEVLAEAKKIDPSIISIIMTAFASTDTAVDALRLGAADYVHKSPNAVNDLRLRVRKELERKRLQEENVLLKRALNAPHRFANIVGSSSAMMAVFELIETIAPTSSTVLITGESGTGKELAARAIHAGSPRSDRPFVAVNCGALPDTLLDSELFGHMRGAFTGADTNKKGLLEVAEKGTIFLDEIGEMSSMVQVKLLRVLQERRFRRLGGTDEVEANIRIIAATNRDLSKMVAAGDFREDLFYRINVIPVKLPALRERQDDIQPLAEHFVDKFAQQMKKDLHGISGGAMACLRNYAWPGNVRELENAIERAVALERTPAVLPDSLPEAVRAACAPATASAATPIEDLTLTGGFDLEQHVQGIEREYIMEALKRSSGVKKNAAELLGLSFRQFRYLLKKYDIH
jgi:two-component system response regulator PilR (NtrC family)